MRRVKYPAYDGDQPARPTSRIPCVQPPVQRNPQPTKTNPHDGAVQDQEFTGD